MKIKQIKLSKMATFCYVIYDDASKTCALIDPAFDTEKILNTVQNDGYRVTHLINTHCHSDHSAGNASIMAKTDAKLYIHRDDAKKLGHLLNKSFARLMGGKSSPKPDVLLEDGDEIHIGETTIKVLHTPGHTRGGICLYLEGNIITGDTLFVGAVGRTDLPGGSFSQLAKSIHEKIYSLPDETIVWPGHDYGTVPRSTVAHQKISNPFTG